MPPARTGSLRPLAGVLPWAVPREPGGWVHSRGVAAAGLLIGLVVSSCSGQPRSSPFLPTLGPTGTAERGATTTGTQSVSSPAAGQVLVAAFRGVRNGVPTFQREIWLLDAARGDHSTRVVALRASEVREIPSGPPALSPDGRFLLWVLESGGPRGCDFTLVADLATGKSDAGFQAGPTPLEGEAADWDCYVSFPAFSPDGSSLAYVADPKAQRVMVKRKGSRPEPLIEFQPASDMGELGIYRLGWSPDGRHLAWLGVVYQSEGLNWPLFVADVATGETRKAAVAAAFAWGPEGRLYFLRLPEGEPGAAPSPTQEAEIFSLDPSGTSSPSLEWRIPDAAGFAPLLAVGRFTFYLVSSSDPSWWSRDRIIAYDRATARKALLYQTTAGWYVDEMVLATTPYLP